ncbi:hypothetical protein MTO96_012928 [Rhipicephalus appendiculatus]
MGVEYISPLLQAQLILSAVDAAAFVAFGAPMEMSASGQILQPTSESAMLPGLNGSYTLIPRENNRKKEEDGTIASSTVCDLTPISSIYAQEKRQQRQPVVPAFLTCLPLTRSASSLARVFIVLYRKRAAGASAAPCLRVIDGLHLT